MVRYSGVADGAEEDGIVIAQAMYTVLRHHPASGFVAFAAPVKMPEAKADAKLYAHGLENTQSLGNHFLPDPVSWNDCDGIGLHSVCRWPVTTRIGRRRPPCKHR